MTAKLAGLPADVTQVVRPAPSCGRPLVPQHGALSRADAARLFGVAELAAMLDAGDWVELWTGVVVPAPRQGDPATRAAAALLRAGPRAVLSGATAAAMHGCTAGAGPVTHVTVPYDRQVRSSSGLSVRQAWIRESDVVELAGLRVFALDIALAELLCTGPQRLALACLEQALGRFDERSAEHFRGLVRERIARRRDRRGTRQATGLLELAWPTPGFRRTPATSGGGR